MPLKRFGTFEGVFTPCLLSILGVIMYLRLGWVVGQVGLWGTVLIIALSHIVTLATALAMSSIVTNIRIGSGGAYSIITKSLGIEVGGAIGIPLYLSQAISVAFYITGFSECWISVFPQHPLLAVSLSLWGFLLVVSYFSAKLAFRIQYGVMTIIGISLFSVFLGHNASSAGWNFDGLGAENFWSVFAIFFPAVTGILAGASMSGELIDPKESIPRGTIGAILVGFVIYTALSFWFASNASANALVENTSIIIDLSRWRWIVIAGIMGATFSSALNMFVSSPRTLFAMGQKSIVPFSSSFSQVNRRGEPSSAIFLTALIALLTVLLSSLNEVATLLTMIFLITYGMINLVVFIEHSIGIASFRPSFRVSRIIPFIGAVGCVTFMFLINIKFSLAAIAVIAAAYIFLLRREIKTYSPNISSGILIYIAEQMAKIAAKLPYYPKIWKPNLLILVEDKKSSAPVNGLISDIVRPNGRLIFFYVLKREEKKTFVVPGVMKAEQAWVEYKDSLDRNLSSSVDALKEEGLLIETTVVEAENLREGTQAVIQTLQGMYFPPNTFFYFLSDDEKKDETARGILKQAFLEGLGVIVLKYHDPFDTKDKRIVNLWIRKESPNTDLSILTALQLGKNWDGQIRLIQVAGSIEEQTDSLDYLRRLKGLMRLPFETRVEVLVGKFRNVIQNAPQADINIFGMPEEPDLNLIRTASSAVRTPVLFLRDSKHESAIA